MENNNDNNNLKDIANALAIESHDNLDLIMSDALKQLSVKDREQIFHEVHGVFDESIETPDFVLEKLEDLQIALNTILGRCCIDGEAVTTTTNLPTAAIELAESLRPEYVSDKDLRLGFLRSENFDATMAAIRMVKFFDFKFSMFGGEKLCKKRITYDDLEPDDTAALEAGFFGWLPERDRAGRPVNFFFPSKQRYNSGCDTGRVYGRLYMYLMSMMDDEFTQKKGYVLIIYNVGEINVAKLPHDVPSVFWKAHQAMAPRLATLHVCFSNPLFRIIAQNVIRLLGKKLQAASKVHKGTHTEVSYALMTYGIPASLLPIGDDGKLTRNNHLELLRLARAKEEYMKNESGLEYCIIPYMNDVIFGKGETVQNKPGNVRLKNLVDEILPKYDTLDRTGKTQMQIQVVKTVHLAGGRFLSNEVGVWMEVPLDAAKQKVATLFRNRRKVQVRKNKTSSTSKKASRSDLEKNPSSVEINKRIRV